jgi:hypothetical protein
LLLPGMRLFFFVCNLALLHPTLFDFVLKSISFTADIIAYFLNINLTVAVNREIDLGWLTPKLLDGNFVVRAHNNFFHISQLGQFQVFFSFLLRRSLWAFLNSSEAGLWVLGHL